MKRSFPLPGGAATGSSARASKRVALAEASGPQPAPQAASDSVDDDFDAAVATAVKLVATRQKASTSFFRDQMKIGYKRALRIMQRIEAMVPQIVGPPDAAGQRAVFIGAPKKQGAKAPTTSAPLNPVTDDKFPDQAEQSAPLPLQQPSASPVTTGLLPALLRPTTRAAPKPPSWLFEPAPAPDAIFSVLCVDVLGSGVGAGSSAGAGAGLGAFTGETGAGVGSAGVSAGSTSGRFMGTLALRERLGWQRPVLHATPIPNPAISAPTMIAPSCALCDGAGDVSMSCCGSALCSGCLTRQLASRAIDSTGGKRCALCRRELDETLESAVVGQTSWTKTRGLQLRQAALTALSRKRD